MSAREAYAILGLSGLALGAALFVAFELDWRLHQWRRARRARARGGLLDDFRGP